MTGLSLIMRELERLCKGLGGPTQRENIASKKRKRQRVLPQISRCLFSHAPLTPKV